MAPVLRRMSGAALEPLYLGLLLDTPGPQYTLIRAPGAWRERQVLLASVLGSALTTLMWTHPTLAPPVLYHLHPLPDARPSSGQPPIGQLLVLPFLKAQSQYLGPWSDLYNDPEGGEGCTEEMHPLGSSFYLPYPLEGLFSESSGQRGTSPGDASELL